MANITEIKEEQFDRLDMQLENLYGAIEEGLSNINHSLAPEVYGDTIGDAIADIAYSLRILSGREQLKKRTIDYSEFGSKHTDR